MDVGHSARREPRVPGRALIAGFGKIGASLGSLLAEGGHEVIAIRRTPPGGSATGVRMVVAQDLSLGPPSGIPVCDSLVITLPPDADGGDDIYATALENLADGLPSPPSRVRFLSSTRLFEGRAGARPLTEVDEPRALGPRAGQLLRAEELASQLFNAHIIRPAGNLRTRSRIGHPSSGVSPAHPSRSRALTGG